MACAIFSNTEKTEINQTGYLSLLLPKQPAMPVREVETPLSDYLADLEARRRIVFIRRLSGGRIDQALDPKLIPYKSHCDCEWHCKTSGCDTLRSCVCVITFGSPLHTGFSAIFPQAALSVRLLQAGFATR